jgi:hypothetical protein
MKCVLSILFVLMTLMAACSIGYVINMKEKTDYPEGRYLYASKCNSCHRLYDPKSFSITKWDSILIKMKQKAKLTDEQRELINNWILEKQSTKIDSLTTE